MDKKAGAAIVAELYELSRAVGDWVVKCSEGSEEGWMWYGHFYYDLDQMREFLTELTRGEKAERDWKETLLEPGNRHLVLERLHELKDLIGEWAGLCEKGELKGFMACGEFRSYVDAIRDSLGVARTPAAETGQGVGYAEKVLECQTDVAAEE